MKNKGLFSTLFIDELRNKISLDDQARGRLATLSQTWKTADKKNTESLWDSFIKQAISYLQFVPPNNASLPGVYPLYEDWAFSNCITVLYLTSADTNMDNTTVGRFWPAKLIIELKKRKLNWGILTNGKQWRLYSLKSSRPFEDYVELPLADAIETNDEAEYGLFERFFHLDVFLPKDTDDENVDREKEREVGVYKCHLDYKKEESEKILDDEVKTPLLQQIDEILQYLCNGFIADTPKKGDEYTEEERKEIFESAVKLLYRCLFLFYAESRRLLPTDDDQSENYTIKYSIHSICQEAHKFQWRKRDDTQDYDLWNHLKGLINAVNEGDPEYGIMGYNGGLFDDEQEKFLGAHKLRNDYLARALYLLAYVEPENNNVNDEYEIPYEDLEVRHLGEMYENILEYSVHLADADLLKRKTKKKGNEFLLASEHTRKENDSYIEKGDIYFGESALERKQTGSYYTPESLVRFLNMKAIIAPLKEKFENNYRHRFNEFLEQINSAPDVARRQGAWRAALALIERFVNEVVLEFKACDPAMGSGHFLVDASNQMTGLIIELLAELPDIYGIDTPITSEPNHWRRKIARYCLYGVDLNSLAVDLAKLSLWLNCFARDHKLTFLDHHLRCGNSLIGIRSLDQLKTIPNRSIDKKNKTHSLQFNFENLSQPIIEAAEIVKAINNIEEDETELQKIEYEKAYDKAETILFPLANLYTSYLMFSNINQDMYRNAFSLKANNDNNFKYSAETGIDSNYESNAKKHKFFHWPIEFPDVFNRDSENGFNATIGNPPWEKVKPNSVEFFSHYDPNFRKYTRHKADQISNELMKNNITIRSNWETYYKVFIEQINYYHELEAYNSLGVGDINTFKLFLEQFLNLLKTGGRIGIVVPSGFYIDRGCKPIRQLLFDKSTVLFIYSFENRWPVTFNGVDGRFKFVVMSCIKKDKTNNFKCAFMEHNVERLPFIENKAITINIQSIKKTSQNLNILEFKNQKDIDICDKIYKSPILKRHKGIFCDIFFSDEIHLTKASKAGILNKSPDSALPLWEGKMINMYDSFYAKPSMWIEKKSGEFFFSNKDNISGHSFWYQNYRLSYRRVAASTNERTIVAAIIPNNVFSSYSLYNILLVSKRRRAISAVPQSTTQLLLLAFMASYVFDYVARLKFSINLVPSDVCEIPIPDIQNIDKVHISLIVRAARLICTNEKYAKLWEDVYSDEWQSFNFWYPDGNMKINSYGPIHEHNVRENILNSAKDLKKQWQKNFAVYDRTSNNRDTGNRSQLRAEIDAYIAHLYNLSRDEFEYILDSFPVLRKKEQHEFGEYMSKRKCLEEYDRIASIL